MELIKTDRKIGCEMGACKNLATFTVKMARVGIKSRLHICEDCLNELKELICANSKPQKPPKSIETYKKRSKDAKEVE